MHKNKVQYRADSRSRNANQRCIKESDIGRLTKLLAACNETHVLCDVVLSNSLSTQASHGACAIVKQHTIPSVGVRIRNRTKDALIRVHSGKDQRLLIDSAKVLVQRLSSRPQPAHTCLVEEHIARLSDRLEGLIQLCVPCSLEEAAALVAWELSAEADVPTKRLVEASLNSWCHCLQVVLSKTPVEPSNLDAFLPAPLDDPQSGLNRLNASGVISVLGVDKVVLHVDDNQDGIIGVESESSVVVAFLVALDCHPPLGSPRKIEFAIVWKVEPLLLTAEGNWCRTFDCSNCRRGVLFFL
jgi:hypothetical protein